MVLSWVGGVLCVGLFGWWLFVMGKNYMYRKMFGVLFGMGPPKGGLARDRLNFLIVKQEILSRLREGLKDD